jgi:hypothetical protein
MKLRIEMNLNYCFHVSLSAIILQEREAKMVFWQ